jgi:hypothetical protein
MNKLMVAPVSLEAQATQAVGGIYASEASTNVV